MARAAEVLASIRLKTGEVLTFTARGWEMKEAEYWPARLAEVTQAFHQTPGYLPLATRCASTAARLGAEVVTVRPEPKSKPGAAY